MKTPSKTLLKDYVGLRERNEAGELSPEELQRLEMLRDVLVELGALSRRDVAAPASTHAEADRVPAEIGTRPLVLVKLSDAGQQGLVLDALLSAGVKAEPSSAAWRTAALVIVDPGTAPEFASAQLVMMNASGPDALVGKLAQLQPGAFIKRRAPLAELLEAVSLLLTPEGRSGNG